MVYVIKKSKGFTLIELLVVIAIIGILSTIAMLAFNIARSKSRDARRLSDVKQISTALAMYKDTYNSYPFFSNCSNNGYAAFANSYIGDDCWRTFSGSLSQYFENGSVPKDPTNDARYFYTYTYNSMENGKVNIYLRYALENDNPNMGSSNSWWDNGVHYYTVSINNY